MMTQSSNASQPTIRAVTVYCSSSNRIPRAYADAAAELGRAIASNNWQLVYGGNCVGCMGTLADAARARWRAGHRRYAKTFLRQGRCR